ncbi:MAG TPA: hypothetical protein VIH93_00090 [Thermoanaerobaculia bacterium]
MSETLIQPPLTPNQPQPPWTPLKVLKGAVVAISRTNAQQKTVVAFQYNPVTLTRNLSPVLVTEGAGGSSVRFNATAKQTIDVTITLDATDDGGPQGNGILPQLAMLELLINPSSAALNQYWTSTQGASIEVLPPLAPRTLFVWGPNRVLPVKLTTINVTEKEFNTNLNPIFAEVKLGMEVYPYNEAGQPEYSYLLTNLQKLETMSALVPTTGVTIGVDPSGLT